SCAAIREPAPGVAWDRVRLANFQHPSPNTPHPRPAQRQRRQGDKPIKAWTGGGGAEPCAAIQRKAATRAACSEMTRALSSSGLPAGSPLIFTNGLDQTGRRGQPPQLSL